MFSQSNLIWHHIGSKTYLVTCKREKWKWKSKDAIRKKSCS